MWEVSTVITDHVGGQYSYYGSCGRSVQLLRIMWEVSTVIKDHVGGQYCIKGHVGGSTVFTNYNYTIMKELMKKGQLSCSPL